MVIIKNVRFSKSKRSAVVQYLRITPTCLFLVLYTVVLYVDYFQKVQQIYVKIYICFIEMSAHMWQLIARADVTIK